MTTDRAVKTLPSRAVPKAAARLTAAALALFGVAACSAQSAEEQQLREANVAQVDSIAALRTELLEHVMEGSRFVNEINQELAKARSLSPNQARRLEARPELADINEERRQAVARITQLVQRLDAVQGRLNGVRLQLAEKDSAFSAKIAEYERMLAEVNQAAERQRAEFQAIVDSQGARIATLASQVDTLNRQLGDAVAERNAAYYVIGTRAELIEKGVLVPEGPRRFLLVGSRGLAPARDLDPTLFTKIDRLSDSTIILPDGEYKIVSRQNTEYVSPQSGRDGKVAGAIRIEQPEQFWSTSRFLIIVRS